MNIKNTLQTLGFLFLPLAIGSASGFFSNPMPNPWFETLIKPALNPPSWIFGPVWTTLYLLMGISFIIIYKAKKSPTQKTASILFFAQLFLNFIWSPLFFRFHLLNWALFDLILLDITVLATIMTFWKIKPKASILLIPYLLWISFATYLNFSLWLLN